MATTVIDRELIKEPGLWALTLRVSQTSLDVLATCRIKDFAPVCRHLPLETDGSAASLTRALEEAVYDNPVLLGDFSRINIAIDTDKFMVVPDEIADDPQLVTASAETVLPEATDTRTEWVPCTLKGLGAVIMIAVDECVAAFLHRTFIDASLTHPLASLCRYFNSKDPLGNTGRMYVNLRQGLADIVAFGDRTLTLANTFAFHDIMDVAYYVMACRNSLGLDPASDQLMLSGDTRLRESLTPLLRRWLGYVMPVAFPMAMFKTSDEALAAPFDLIATSLCE